MENFAQIYVKLDIFGIFLFKKGLNPISLVAALLPLLLFPPTPLFLLLLLLLILLSLLLHLVLFLRL